MTESSTDVLHQVRQTIKRHRLLATGDGVVAGVSGGPDSLCLLHLLLRLREPYRLSIHVAHLHHGARGSAADADAEFVATQATEWGVPVTIERMDVPRLAQERNLAFEEAARRARYAFLAQVARTTGGCRIAVGHNADDQAETVLMHFLRGAGLAGLRGMLPLTPITDYRLIEPFNREAKQDRSAGSSPGSDTLDIIRPLLDVPRADIERYCADQHLTPRFDRSNLDTTYFRNRLRHELLPLLETYNPNIRERLRHTAAVVAGDYDLLARLRDEAWTGIVQEEGNKRIVVGLEAWRALPVALQRSTLRQAAYRLRRSLRDVGFVHVEDARMVGLTGETGAQATLPKGLVLTVGYTTLEVARDDAAPRIPDEPLLWQTEPLPVHLPGLTPLPQTDWTLEADLLTEWDRSRIEANADPWTAYLDAGKLSPPLALRSRQPGDRFRPYGMDGHHVKLNALLINLKVPGAWRDQVPLLTAADQIVWVCGRRIAEGAAVGPGTRQVARLRFTREHTLRR